MRTTEFEPGGQANKSAKERAHELLNEQNISKEEFCERTGFSEGQYYRWLGNKQKDTLYAMTATSGQIMHICAVFDWSPTYLFFGLGPTSLSATAPVPPGQATALEQHIAEASELAAKLKPVEVLAIAIETNQLVKEIAHALKG